MRTLIFDTETTGMWNFKADLADPDQPRPVQISALLYADSIEVAGINLLINCQVPSHPKALEVHRKTPELLRTCGLEELTALAIFNNFARRADRIVAHNIEFDKRIVQGMALRNNLTHNALESTPLFCTMKTSTDVLRIPGRFGGFKWPKLIEAYKELVDPAGFADAHDALADTRACAAILFALEDQGIMLEEINRD